MSKAQLPSRLNQTVANASTKSQTMLFSQDVNESRVETLRVSRQVFFANEKKKLNE